MDSSYKIIKELGKGGTSNVFLVQKDKKYFAMKKVNLKMFNKEVIKQYENEIKILSNFNNDYIVKYYESYIENDYFNIIMEYGGDSNLKIFIKKQKEKNELIDEKLIEKIIIQICLGLKEIHKSKIIHRDLTPDNIFINKNNEIKIGDFGISKELGEEKDFTNSIVGKYKYFAPEIENGENYDYKVDIYAFGCIIYELFTLNEYYLDKKIENKDIKIDTNIYNKKWQYLIDLLLNENYNERPNIDQIYNYIIKINNYDKKDYEDKNKGKEINLKNIKKYEKKELNKEEKNKLNSYKLSQKIIELYNKMPYGKEKIMIRYIINKYNDNQHEIFEVEYAKSIIKRENNKDKIIEYNEIEYEKELKQIKIINEDIFNILKNSFSFKNVEGIEDIDKLEVNSFKEKIGKFQKNNFKNAFNDIFSEKGIQRLDENNEIKNIFLLDNAFDQIQKKIEKKDYSEYYDEKSIKEQIKKEREKEINNSEKIYEVNLFMDGEEYGYNNEKIKTRNRAASISNKTNFLRKLYSNEKTINEEKIFTSKEIKDLGIGNLNFVENQNAIERMIDKYKIGKIKSSYEESIESFEKEIEKNDPKLLEFLLDNIENNSNNKYEDLYLILKKYKIINKNAKNKEEIENIVQNFIKEIQVNKNPKDKTQVLCVLVFQKLLTGNISEEEYNNIDKNATELFDKLKNGNINDICVKNWKITSNKIIKNFINNFYKILTNQKLKYLIDKSSNYIINEAIVKTILDNYIINKLKNYKFNKIEDPILPLDDKWIGIKNYIKVNEAKINKKGGNILKNKNITIIIVEEYLSKYPYFDKNGKQYSFIELNQQAKIMGMNIIEYIESEQFKYLVILKEEIDKSYKEFIEKGNLNNENFIDWKNNKIDKYHKEFQEKIFMKQKEGGIEITIKNIESQFKEEIEEMDNKIKERLTIENYRKYLKNKYPEEKWKKDYKRKINNQIKNEYLQNKIKEINDNDKLEVIELIKNKLLNCHELSQSFLLILNENNNKYYKKEFIHELKEEIIDIYINNNNNPCVKFILSDYINAIKYTNNKFYEGIYSKMKKQFKYLSDKVNNYLKLKLNSLNKTNDCKIRNKEQLKNNIKKIVENDTFESLQTNLLDDRINFGMKKYKDDFVDKTLKKIEEEEKFIKEKIEQEKKEAERKKNEEQIDKIIEDTKKLIKESDDFNEKYGLKNKITNPLHQEIYNNLKENEEFISSIDDLLERLDCGK